MAALEIGPREDFTERAYRSLLDHAVKRFRFIKLEELQSTSTSVAVSRHDVDLSPQRALAIARIDHEVGVRSHFYFQLTSEFYSPLEPYFPDLLTQVESLGHEVGLHFDPSGAKSNALHHQVERLVWECHILANILSHDLSSFSIHNPTVSQSELMSVQEVGGMANASWYGWRKLATYCSDSNGHWRFESAHSIVSSSGVRNLYLLTHPEWWTPRALSPFDRLQRALEGRSEANLRDYRQLLSAHGRLFVGDQASQESPG